MPGTCCPSRLRRAGTSGGARGGPPQRRPPAAPAPPFIGTFLSRVCLVRVGSWLFPPPHGSEGNPIPVEQPPVLAPGKDTLSVQRALARRQQELQTWTLLPQVATRTGAGGSGRGQETPVGMCKSLVKTPVTQGGQGLWQGTDGGRVGQPPAGGPRRCPGGARPGGVRQWGAARGLHPPETVRTGHRAPLRRSPPVSARGPLVGARRPPCCRPPCRGCCRVAPATTSPKRTWTRGVTAAHSVPFLVELQPRSQGRPGL